MKGLNKLNEGLKYFRMGFFQKQTTLFYQINHLVYCDKCPCKTCSDDYIGKTVRRIEGKSLIIAIKAHIFLKTCT